MGKEPDVLICNNCKRYWESPKEKCVCGSTALSVTHSSNISRVESNIQMIKPIMIAEPTDQTDPKWITNIPFNDREK